MINEPLSFLLLAFVLIKYHSYQQLLACCQYKHIGEVLDFTFVSVLKPNFFYIGKQQLDFISGFFSLEPSFITL